MNKLLVTAFLSASLAAPVASAQVLGTQLGGQGQGQVGPVSTGVGLSADATANLDRTGRIVRDEASQTVSGTVSAEEKAKAKAKAEAEAKAEAAAKAKDKDAAMADHSADMTGSAHAQAGLGLHASNTGVEASADGQAKAAASSSAGDDDSAGKPDAKRDHPAGRKSDTTP